MRRFVAVLLSVFAVAVTGVVGFALAGPAQQKATAVTNITVHAGEYYFDLSATTAPAGQVVFTVFNDGDISHDFQIAGQRTPILEKGQSATLTVNFTQAGLFNYLCTIGEHAIYGMQGQFTVTGAATTTVVNGTTVTTTQPPPPAPKVKATVKVTESEFKIKLTNTKGKAIKSVPHGRIKFIVTNKGKLPHNFVSNKQQTLVLASKKSQTITINFAKKGSYGYLCSITGHAALGMKGKLKVT